MPELNETNEELIAIAVENKDKDDNETLGLLIGKGVPFNKAKGLLKKIQEEQGLIFTKADRDAKAEEVLSGFSVSADTTAEEVQEQVDNLMDELNCKTGMARGYVKALFDDEELAMPKAVRASAGPRTPKAPGFKGDFKSAADFALANPEPLENDLEEFKAYMEDHGGAFTSTGKDKASRWYGGVVDLRIFGKQWTEATSG